MNTSTRNDVYSGESPTGNNGLKMLLVLVTILMAISYFTGGYDHLSAESATSTITKQKSTDFDQAIQKVSGLRDRDFLEYDDYGNPRLASWRKRKLKRELKDLESDAEQYVLVAKISGNYPCFSCLNSTEIYLKQGEVWKYGVTTKGERGRYQNFVQQSNLDYLVEYRGDLLQCLAQERTKIYNYPILPESQARDFLLIRPPGNKQDS